MAAVAGFGPGAADHGEEFLAVPEGFSACALGFGRDFAGADDELALVGGVEGGDCGVRSVQVDFGEDEDDTADVTGLNYLGDGESVFPGVDRVVLRVVVGGTP